MSFLSWLSTLTLLQAGFRVGFRELWELHVSTLIIMLLGMCSSISSNTSRIDLFITSVSTFVRHNLRFHKWWLLFDHLVIEVNCISSHFLDARLWRNFTRNRPITIRIWSIPVCFCKWMIILNLGSINDSSCSFMLYLTLLAWSGLLRSILRCNFGYRQISSQSFDWFISV